MKNPDKPYRTVKPEQSKLNSECRKIETEQSKPDSECRKIETEQSKPDRECRKIETGRSKPDRTYWTITLNGGESRDFLNMTLALLI